LQKWIDEAAEARRQEREEARARKKQKAAARAKTPAKTEEAPAVVTHSGVLAESHRICPGCGAELIDRGCKMRCQRCGFFLDCSDG
jgi:hypothetical protein